MTADEYEAELVRQMAAFQPWLGITAAQRDEQKVIQAVLARRCGASFGDGAYVAPSALIFTSSLILGARSYIAACAILRDEITIGADCSVNAYAHLAGRISLGAGVRIAANASLAGFNHGFARTDIMIKDQPHTMEGITIGDGCWIGTHAIIVDGVSIGAHCIVAAGAVVTKNFPDYQILAGNPAKNIGNRHDVLLKRTLADFDTKIRRQIPAIIERYTVVGPSEGPQLIDRPNRNAAARLRAMMTRFLAKTSIGAKRFQQSFRIRNWCDAVEICTMFGLALPLLERDDLIAKLQSWQDAETGLVPEFVPSSQGAHCVAPATRRYDTMIVNYALECLGAHIAKPILSVTEIGRDELITSLEGLQWTTGAWGAGDWVDCFASCLDLNLRHFQIAGPLDALFTWLDDHCDPASGLWGAPTAEGDWLQPVNGFYRITRGTYAQFGRKLPYAERAIDTVLAHLHNQAYFGAGRENACNILDVVHPLWLCLQQTSHRREEATAWARAQLPHVISRWTNNAGFCFDLSGTAPSLQGTEMWLAIIYLLTELAGLRDHLTFKPAGVHRLTVRIESSFCEQKEAKQLL